MKLRTEEWYSDISYFISGEVGPGGGGGAAQRLSQWGHLTRHTAQHHSMEQLYLPPPPPPPPWLDMPPLCDCESMPQVTTIKNAQDIFQSVVVVIVLLFCVVIILITIAILLKRRWFSSLNKKKMAKNMIAMTSEKQLTMSMGFPKLPKTPQNYYSQEHHIIVDQTGKTIIIAPGKASADIQPNYDLNIYETVDSEEYESAGDEKASSSSLYENPDAVIYQAGPSQSVDPHHRATSLVYCHSACDYFYCSL